jgi:hypothetical protein
MTKMGEVLSLSHAIAGKKGRYGRHLDLPAQFVIANSKCRTQWRNWRCSSFDIWIGGV